MNKLEKDFMKAVKRLTNSKEIYLDRFRNSNEEIDFIVLRKLDRFKPKEEYLELNHQGGRYNLTYKVRDAWNYEIITHEDFLEQSRNNQNLLCTLYDYLSHKLDCENSLRELTRIKEEKREQEKSQAKLKKNRASRKKDNSEY